jgi:hypothetical protein
VLASLATWGPVAFTIDWVLLGWSHHGYSARAETISALSAYDASRWWVMATGQLVLAAGFVCCAVLTVQAVGREGLLPATFLVLAAVGTVQATLARTICTTTNSAWCEPLPHDVHGWAQWIHGVGAGIAFTSLLLACLAMAWATRKGRDLRDVFVVSLAAELVALPHIVWFLNNVDTTWHGWAEKVFLTSLAAWSAYAGHRLGAVVLARHPRPATVSVA